MMHFCTDWWQELIRSGRMGEEEHGLTGECVLAWPV